MSTIGTIPIDSASCQTETGEDASDYQVVSLRETQKTSSVLPAGSDWESGIGPAMPEDPDAITAAPPPFQLQGKAQSKVKGPTLEGQPLKQDLCYQNEQAKFEYEMQQRPGKEVNQGRQWKYGWCCGR